MSEFHFNPILGWPVVVIAAVILFGLLFVGPARRRVQGKRRLILIALRAVLVVLLLLGMLRPTRTDTELKKLSATLVVMADLSRSMQVADAVGGKSRFDEQAELLQEAAPLLAELAETIQVKVYGFDETTQELELGSDGKIHLGAIPEGEQSAIGAALESVLQQRAQERVAGVILLSDGAARAYAPNDTPPQDAARRMKDLVIPLYTLAFGQARSISDARDIKLEELLAPARVFVKNRLDVSGTLSISGFPRGDAVAVRLLFENADGKMESVAAKSFRPSVDGDTIDVQLSYLPKKEGEYKVTLEADTRDGELVTNNNQLSTFVTVRGGGINVLYLEGALRVESGFIRRALDASADIHVDYRWLQRPTDKFDLEGLLAPGKYDVIILGDVDSTAFNEGDLESLAKMVDSGGGLMMLGGAQSFGPGGYSQTPLADLLPVVMDRLERQRPGDPVSGDLHLPGPLTMLPSDPQGTSHPIMQLAPGAENLETWRKLPPLRGANKFRGLKPNAIRLAETDARRPAPLLVIGQPGGGRVLAFAGDSTWQWALSPTTKDLHRRFWRQAILWLARTEETGEGVWIQLDQRRYGPRKQVEFTTGYRTEEGEPVGEVVLEAEVILPDATTESVALAQSDSQTLGEVINTKQSGDYTVVVRARRGGQLLGEARARFLVFPYDLELDNPAAEPGLLANLSRITEDAGGRSMAAEELTDLLTELRDNPPELEAMRPKTTTYYDRWEWFVLFVVIIGVEWFLRKRWGLV